MTYNIMPAKHARDFLMSVGKIMLMEEKIRDRAMRGYHSIEIADLEESLAVALQKAEYTVRTYLLEELEEDQRLLMRSRHPLGTISVSVISW